jgi:DNA-binding MarR family transcriptional regulator
MTRTAPEAGADGGSGMSAAEGNFASLIELLKLATQISRPMLAEVATPHGVSLNELRVLMSLAGEGELAAHQLSDLTGLPAMAVSRAVSALCEAERLVETRDATNRRRKLLALTPRGYAFYEAVTPDVQRIAKRLFASLTGVERRVSAKVVNKLLAQLEAWPQAED